MLRSVKYGLYAAILAGLVGAPVVWGNVDKAVQLVVDGRSRTVRTSAADVAGVLHDAGYRVSVHDLVAPSPGSRIHDGSRIVLRRGRELHLSINGRAATVWTTATTVRAALGQLGFSTGDFVSVSRSQRLPLSPTDVAIRTPRLVTLVHDRQRQQVSTTDATVADLLADLGVAVGSADRLSAAPTSALEAGEVIRLERVTTRQVVRMRSVPYAVSRRDAPSLYRGTTAILQSGRDGRAKITYSIVYVDGKIDARTVLSRRMITSPVPRVIAVGTGRLEMAKDSSGRLVVTPSAAQQLARSLLARYGWSTSQMSCLIPMWAHESGWRVHAANASGAYGIPQALPGSKMASAGPDWQDNARTQILWGLNYIRARYGTPCGAWAFWQQGGWY